MDSVDFIVKMRDYSKRYGADGSTRGFIRVWREKLHKEKGAEVVVRGLDGEPTGSAVAAYIHQGQWIGECEVCGGHEFVDPSDPVFFCWGCVNRVNNGYLRPVSFPENWEAIEEAVLERPVNDVRGATPLERAGMAQPAVVVVTEDGEYPLVRSWKPGESVEELRNYNKILQRVEMLPGKTVHVRDDRTKSKGDEVSDGIR